MAATSPPAPWDDHQRTASFVDRSSCASPTLDGSVGLDAARAWIDNLSLDEGTPVLLAARQSKLLLELFFAACLAGVTPAIAPGHWPLRQLQAVGTAIGAAVIVTDRHRGQAASPVFPARFAGPLGFHLLAECSALLPTSPGSVILLTRGRSGPVSACLHDRRSLMASARRHAESVGLRADDVIGIAQPLHHASTLVGQVLAAWVVGAELALTGRPTVSVARVAQWGAEVTTAAISPIEACWLINSRWSAAGALRMLTVEGGTLEADLVSALVHAGCAQEVNVVYGLAEVGYTVTHLAAHVEPASRHGSVGKPLPGVSVFLRGKEERGEGELLVRSPTVMRTKRGPSPSRCRVGPSTIATGDWFRVEDGYLYYVGSVTDRWSCAQAASVR